MIPLLYRIINFIYLLRKLKSIQGAWKLSRYKIEQELIRDYSWKNNGLYFPGYNVAISSNELILIDYDINAVFRIIKSGKIGFKNNGSKTVFTTNCLPTTVNFSLSSRSDIYSALEVFGEDIYAYKFNKKLIAVDIGMNVGFASLFFSANDNIEKVYSFEPFEETYLLALENFKLNPDIQNKIIPVNAGIGKEDKTLKVLSQGKGSPGASTTDFFLKEVKREGNQFVEVKINNGSKVIKQIIVENPGCRLLLKLDCEGAEYEILENLDNEGLLNSIDVIMIEWHIKGKESLIRVLQKNGFNLICPDRNSDILVGMIYGFRQEYA